MTDQCFVCGLFGPGEAILGFHCCTECKACGGELVITTQGGEEGSGVYEAIYLTMITQVEQ